MDKDAAIEIAKRWASGKDLQWREPTGAEFTPASNGHPDAWVVTSNYQTRGYQIMVSIDGRSGKVIHARTLGRNVQTWDSESA